MAVAALMMVGLLHIMILMVMVMIMMVVMMMMVVVVMIKLKKCSLFAAASLDQKIFKSKNIVFFGKASFLWLAVSLGRKTSLANTFGEFASKEYFYSAAEAENDIIFFKHLIGC